MRKGQDVVGKL